MINQQPKKRLSKNKKALLVYLSQQQEQELIIKPKLNADNKT